MGTCRPGEAPRISHPAAATGSMAYSDTFHAEGNSAIQRIENSLFPKWNGTDLNCTFEFENDTLRLIGDAGGLVQHLLCQRV